MDLIKIFALGGLDESGRDCYVVEINNDIFVIDCGMSLPDKTIPGIDYLLPNPDYLIKNKDRVKAFIITHGHDEQMSALKYFYDKLMVPIYCTESTKVAMIGQANILHVKQNFKFVIVSPSSDVTIANRKFHFFQTCHNAANSFGVAIETDRGNIVYSGDYIVDWTANEKEFCFDMKAIGKLTNKETFILMAESKFANRNGYCAPKHRVTNLIEKYFKYNDKRIFINSFWQNTFRIYEVVNLCRKYNKKLYFYNEYTRSIMEMNNNEMPGLLDGVDIISNEDLLRVRKQEIVVLLLGHGEELYDELVKIANGQNNDKRITLTKEDIFINAALPVPTLEVVATRSVDYLYRTGCEIVYIKSKNVDTMHAHQEDLKFFLSLLKPKYYIPVRGSFVNMMDNAKLALSMDVGLTHNNVFILDNGMQLIFEQDFRPQIIPNDANKINITPCLVDGKGIASIGAEVIEERKKLSIDGVVIIAATVSLSQKKIIAGPDCQMRGFVYVKEAEPLLKSVSSIFVEEINFGLVQECFDVKKISAVVSERVKKYIKRENGRDPLIMPIIVTINN